MLRLILIDRLEKSVLVNFKSWHRYVAEACKSILIIEEVVVVLDFDEEVANVEKIFVANPGHFDFYVHLQLTIRV